MQKRALAPVILLTTTLILSMLPTVQAVADWELKTVTWNDATQETIQVKGDGTVHLNGSAQIAFGLHITVGASEVVENAVLDQCETWGIRFMTLDLSSWLTPEDCGNFIADWYPKLYAHKMFVEFGFQESPAGNLNATAQTERFQALVDLMTNETYANMTYACTYGWEMDLAEFGHNSAELHTYFTAVTPSFRTILDASLLGNIPLIGKIVAPSDVYGAEEFFQHNDIVGYDYYVDPTMMYGHTSSRFNTYRAQNLVAGKNDYKIWLQENGVQPQFGSNVYAPYNPQHFQYVLAGAFEYDVAECMLWTLLWDTEPPTYNFTAFSQAGNPYDWITNLSPYFPTTPAAGPDPTPLFTISPSPYYPVHNESFDGLIALVAVLAIFGIIVWPFVQDFKRGRW